MENLDLADVEDAEKIKDYWSICFGEEETLLLQYFDIPFFNNNLLQTLSNIA